MLTTFCNQLPKSSRLCMCVCVGGGEGARVLTRCAKSGHCACSTHAKCGPLTKSTHSTSAVGFGIRFGLVILENPGIDYKIMVVA